MGIAEQITGIIIIGIGFAAGLLYVLPKTVKEVKALIKEIFFEEKSGVNDNDGMPL